MSDPIRTQIFDLNKSIVKNRYRNVYTLPLFLALVLFFMWLGIHFKNKFFFSFYWYTWMGFTGLLLVLGLLLFISYLQVIIRHRGEQTSDLEK